MNDERIERYLAGQMAPDEQSAFEREILADPELASIVYTDAQVQTLLAHAAEARAQREEIAAAATRSPRRAWWHLPALRWAVPAAAIAAAIAIFALVDRAPNPSVGPEVFRGEGPGFEAVSPQGEVSHIRPEFVWTSLPGAAKYRFELFDAASKPVHTVVTADTSVSVAPTIPARGYWTVTPLDENLMTMGPSLTIRYQVTP